MKAIPRHSMVVILAGLLSAAACGGSGVSGAGGPPAPSTGGATPAAGGTDPGAGGTTSAAGGTTSATGGATSAAGGTTSATGGATSAAGGATSAAGGATSAAGGTTSATGGATSAVGGSGGVDSGVGGSGDDTPAEIPIDATGWVASDSTRWGIQGAWYWFSDADGGGLTELDGVTEDTAPYVDGSGMCLTGATPGGGADEYVTWGAGIGLDLNYDEGSSTTLPFDAAAAGIAGFDITITGSAPGGLIVKFLSANPMPSGEEAPSVALEEGVNHVVIIDAVVPSWASNAGEQGDPSSVAAIQIQAGSGETGGTIDFCVTSIVPFEVEANCTASFMRGINLGNRLDAPSEGDWGPVLSETDFQYVAERGFDHIRLPVRFSGHAETTAPYTIDETFFERVDWAIDQALGQCLSVVLDLHHYDEIMSDPTGHADRFLGLWSQIAERYQSYPGTLAFELLNEPSGSMDGPTWSALAAQAITLLRTTNPNRDIIVDGVEYAATRGLSELTLPDDPHVLASVHTYEPSLFTFQGQDWMGPEYATTGVVFPGPPATPLVPVAEAEAVAWISTWFNDYNTLPSATNPCGPAGIAVQFDAVSEYTLSTGHRVYDGEWGAQEGGDVTSRANWMRAIRDAAEAADVGWAVWDDQSNLTLFDPATGEWDEALVGVLFD